MREILHLWPFLACTIAINNICWFYKFRFIYQNVFILLFKATMCSYIIDIVIKRKFRGESIIDRSRKTFNSLPYISKNPDKLSPSSPNNCQIQRIPEFPRRSSNQSIRDSALRASLYRYLTTKLHRPSFLNSILFFKYLHQSAFLMLVPYILWSTVDRITQWSVILSSTTWYL
jgi:hypothetical protein